MSIYTKLKMDFLAFRKIRSPNANTLVTALSDIQLIAKNENREVTDQDCITVIKKHIKGLDEMIVHTDCMKSKLEKSLLNSYLPTQLGEAAIREIIIQKGLSGVPTIMKFFKENYPGQYDGKLLSEVAKSISV